MAGPLKIGIIGTGSISALHLLAMNRASEKVKLMAACDVREEAVRNFAGRAGITAVYTDAATMLHDADIEAVDICVSHQWHKDVAIAAAKAGKHILLEKPMANSLKECREIIAAAEKAGVTFMVAQQLRHHPSYMAVKRLIQKGELGQVWALALIPGCPLSCPALRPLPFPRTNICAGVSTANRREAAP
jgi:predicted dehydrogenase